MQNAEFRMKNEECADAGNRILNSQFSILHSAFTLQSTRMSPLLPFFAFALGAIVGSFLNVVIHRYPLEQSIVFPSSHCPQCGAAIRWYDNVPVLSFLALRGRCRACHAPIAARYPLVELANALFYLALYLHTGPTIAFPMLAAVISMTIVLIYIDAEIQILPDVIDLPGMVIGVGIGALALGGGTPTLIVSTSLIDSLLGALLGAVLLIAIIGAYWLVRRAEGMGQGDVKMLAMIGAVLGWRAVPAVLLLASVGGAVVGVPAALRSGRGMQLPIPFGVFLGLAALAVLFFGHTLSGWYLSLLLR
jgi:leader peptidase (prepilin peptidase)/N-methyltransferase